MANLIDSNLKTQNYNSLNNSVLGKNGKKKIGVDKNTIGSIAGSAIGIAAGVAGVYGLAKKKNPSLMLRNLNYEERDVLMIGAGSVLGGLAGGLLTDDDKNNVKPKLREASQQFFGSMVCPIGLLALGNKILEKNNVNKIAPKVAMTMCALFGGMEIGNKIMNKVNDKIFNEKVEHKVKPSDYLVHTDDLCLSANMILKNVKSISKVTSKILPATFVVAGTHTGTEKKED